MWFEITQDNFSVQYEGLYCHKKGANNIYSSLQGDIVNEISDLMEMESCFAIEVKPEQQQVSFARDYLGFFPLIYTAAENKLFITDEMARAVEWLKQHGITPSVSDQSLALYFTMGYIPQGRSLYSEIYSCCNASIYIWSKGVVHQNNCFTPIDVDPAVSLSDLDESIEKTVKHIDSLHDEIDVWCSGGLDSAIMAQCFNSNGRQARLLSMGYSKEVTAEFGRGEIPFVELMQKSLDAELDFVVLDHDCYCSAYEQFVQHHIGPVVDTVVVPKYALAQGTRSAAVTGEGGDPLFSGVKNNVLLFVMQNAPHVNIGEAYARAHDRLFDHIETLFENGAELKHWVISYMNEMIEKYPGDLVRKLFYLNTFEKQGGMIFPKNYYAAKANDIKIYHPLTSLETYKIAFAIADDKKYRYPKGKLALIDIYRDRLPSDIVNRKKTGTRLPISLYLNAIDSWDNAREVLDNTDFLKAQLLGKYQQVNDECLALKNYALVTLANWIHYKNQLRGRENDTDVPPKYGRV